MAIKSKNYSMTSYLSDVMTWTETLPNDFQRLISCNVSYRISGNSITFMTSGLSERYTTYKQECTTIKKRDPNAPPGRNDPRYMIEEEVCKLVPVTKYRYNHSAEIQYSNNSIPSVPSSITCSDNLKVNKNAVITWGASNDADGNTITYALYAQYGGSENRTLLYSGTKTTFSYTIPDGVDRVVFSVNATDGEDTSDFAETGILPVQTNSAPVISGEDKRLETKGQPITFEYSVYDEDGDSIEVTETLNGVQIKKLTNAPQKQTIVAEVTLEDLKKIPTGQENTLLIQAKDTKGQSTFRRITFVKTNTPPKISVTGLSEGATMNKPISFTVEAMDEEGDATNVTLYLDGKEIAKKDLKAGETKMTYTMPTDNWVKLSPEKHVIKIVAKDVNESSASKSITFTRRIDKIEFTAVYHSEKLKNVVNRLYVTMQWMLADGVVPKILMCNNALDNSPKWEDVTKQILNNTDVILANSSKTNADWAIGVHVTIDRGTATKESWIGAIGGAIKEAK